MTSPHSPVLQTLRHLDASATDFWDRVCNVLRGEEYVRCQPNFEGDDLTWLVNYLDKVLDGLGPSSAAFRKCLRELKNMSPEPFAWGGCGVVYKGTYQGSTVCVKRLQTYGAQKPIQMDFCREAVMWKRLEHPNIVSLLGITISPHPQLVSDWMPGGDLPKYIVHNPDADRVQLVSDIAQGLRYMHTHNVVHGDLKGVNVLVDGSGCARIADFGLSTVTKNQDSLQSASHLQGFTARWAAPEILHGGPHSMKSDIFSFAMVVIEVFTGALPFGNLITVAAMFSILQERRPSRPTHPMFTGKLWLLVNHCWEHNPHSRPEISEVVQRLLILDTPLWKQLITRPPPRNGSISLIMTIFSDDDQIRMVENLSGEDARKFADEINKVLGDPELEPQIFKKCQNFLCHICGHQAFLPRSLEVPFSYNEEEDPVSQGGLADVWRGRHKGRDVAVQVYKRWPGSNINQVRKEFCMQVMAWRAFNHFNVLSLVGATVADNLFVTVSEWMGRCNIREFTEANVNVDRLELLRGVVRGLIYMHDQGAVHGDLRGTNIMVDDHGHVRLTGFILTVSAQSTGPVGSTIPWTSPEVLDPEGFGFGEGTPTKESDCYALGMVIYEVISGETPFATYTDELEVVQMILDGVRPERPQGGLFTNEVWEVLGRCWKEHPRNRPGIDHVLVSLGGDQGRGIEIAGVGGQSDGRRGTALPNHWDPEHVVEGLGRNRYGDMEVDTDSYFVGGCGNTSRRDSCWCFCCRSCFLCCLSCYRCSCIVS